MGKTQFTSRHNKLLKLKDNIDLLMLGEKNKDYREYLQKLRESTVKELRLEQAKLGLLPNQKSTLLERES